MTGRPRDPQLENRLLGAAWELLVEDGYAALTLAQVAARAQAHRTDVYRRWSTKAQLVADALAARLPPVPAVDTGSLRADLRAHLESLAQVWSASWVDGVIGLVADLQRDVDAELAFRDMASERGGQLRQVLERARARGDIGANADVSLAADVLEGALMHRRLIGRQALTPEFLDSLATAVHALLTVERVRA